MYWIQMQYYRIPFTQACCLFLLSHLHLRILFGVVLFFYEELKMMLWMQSFYSIYLFSLSAMRAPGTAGGAAKFVLLGL